MTQICFYCNNSIANAKRGAETLLASWFDDPASALNTDVAMCSDDVTAALDTTRNAVMTRFAQHTLSISSTTATATAAVETAAAELTAMIDARCDRVREHQRLLHTELDQLVTAEQGVYTDVFANEMQKLTGRLPLSTAKLNSGISTALQATTECMLEQLAELVPDAALRDELQNYTAAADTAVFRELPTV
jgi:hypothetical protein